MCEGYIVKSESLKISGMTGQACASKVEHALNAVGGVSNVNVSLAQMEATVQFDENVTNNKDMLAAVQAAGYGAAKASCKGSCCGSCGG
jgi:copper chaperone CopZ